MILIKFIGKVQIPYISNLIVHVLNEVHDINEGRGEVRGHSFDYFTMVLHIVPNVDFF